ncbi:MAG: EamA family transporter, partial [Mesorhizobium sp.]
MTLFVFFAVLAAAAMHAIWNALVKVHLDRFLSITLMTLGMGFAALFVLPFVEFPKAEVWPFILASVFFHMGYRTFLIGAYKAGDFAQTYPLARGTAPLLSALGGMVVVREVPASLAILGILLLSAGTLVMSFRGGVHLE